MQSIALTLLRGYHKAHGGAVNSMTKVGARLVRIGGMIERLGCAARVAV
jgi:hypothetical protein